MDVADFEDWLGGIAALTPPQRRQAWQALALSEASDLDDIDAAAASGADSASGGSVVMTVTPRRR
jgi:hypothetical protein